MSMLATRSVMQWNIMMLKFQVPIHNIKKSCEGIASVMDSVKLQVVNYLLLVNGPRTDSSKGEP
jgi:hypothetical protein